MIVTFSGRHAINHEILGINFEAIVDGVSVVCKISQHALEDINPSGRLKSVEQNFLDNRSYFEQIAMTKILQGIENVFITVHDITSS